MSLLQSIVVIGVGDGPFEKMVEFDDGLPVCVRKGPATRCNTYPINHFLREPATQV